MKIIDNSFTKSKTSFIISDIENEGINKLLNDKSYNRINT